MDKNDDGFDKLMDKWNAFETSHEKIILNDRFEWFDRSAFSIIKKFADTGSLDLEVEKTDTDITVYLIGDEILMIDNDICMKKLLQHVDVCSITPENNRIRTKLWFRCWEWEKLDNL